MGADAAVLARGGAVTDCGWKWGGLRQRGAREAVMLPDEHMRTGSSLVQRAKNSNSLEGEKEREKERKSSTGQLSSTLK